METSEAVTRRCSVKKVFLKFPQNSQETACVGDSFLGLRPAILSKKGIQHKCFPVNTCFTKHLRWLLLIFVIYLMVWGNTQWCSQNPQKQLTVVIVIVSYCWKVLHHKCLQGSWLRLQKWFYLYKETWNPLKANVLQIGWFQKQPPEVVCKKRCSKKFLKIRRKTPVLESLF